MKQLSYKQLTKYLQDLFSCHAFELHTNDTPKGTRNISIPYMMNDALECYLLLEDIRITGEFQKDFKGEMSVEFTETPTGPALVFHQGYENVFTIWFEHCYKILTCYRYDQIGHFWVTGAEHWRRLVYMVGTIYDKYEYLGEAVCNKKELSLLPLMEFAPFRAYSPIHESLDPYYSESFEGLLTMEAFANKAGDKGFANWLKLYRLLSFRWVQNLLAKQLLSPKRAALYEFLSKRIEEASCEYPDRDYGDELNQKISNERGLVASTLREHGFTGEYPLFQKDSMQIYAVEEHPFTVLDWEHFSFRIQFMVSEAAAPCSSLHYGFFKRHGNLGRIESSLDFLERM